MLITKKNRSNHAQLTLPLCPRFLNVQFIELWLVARVFQLGYGEWFNNQTVYALHTLFSHRVTPHTYHKHQYSYILLTNSWIPKLPKGDYRSQRVINLEATWEMWFHSHTYMHLKPFNFKRPLALIGVQGNENRKHRVQFSNIHNTCEWIVQHIPY